jgi:ribosomal protein S18 acetylase RimI-like enzyme
MIRVYIDADIPQLDELTQGFQNYMVGIDERNELRKFSSIDEAHKYMGKLISDASDMDGVVLVAEEGGKIVGYVQGIIDHHTDDENVMYLTSHNQTVDGWVGVLYVDPAYRGKKLGRALFDAIKHNFVDAGCQTLRLLVMKDNVGSVKFYESYGMKIRDVEMVVSL